MRGRAISAVAVGIPARNEARTIARCISAVVAAGEACGLPVTIVVAADRCDDDTAALAALAMTATPSTVTGVVVRVERGSAGGTRDDACRAALDRSAGPAAETWLATTDGDSSVPLDWLTRQLAWVATGADGVAGLVRLDDSAPVSLRRRARQLQEQLGAGLGHPHVYGANLGVRADRWLAAGGFPEVSVGEDHALWHSLRADGATLIAANDVVVTTSGRLVGRAPNGFASVLARLALGAD